MDKPERTYEEITLLVATMRSLEEQRDAINVEIEKAEDKLASLDAETDGIQDGFMYGIED